MVRSVLVGLDGSAYSDSAVALGIDWARRFDALVVGLGIVDKPSIFQPEMVPLGADAYKQPADEARLARATRQVEQFLEKFSLRCAEAGVSSKVLEDVGNPYEQILREAQRYDVILLGKQTYFHFATQEGPCETLKSVLKNTPRPVVTVPEKLGAGTSIVIAYDGSLQAARALQAFQGLGLDSTQPVHVVTVGKDHIEACRHTDRAIEFLAFHGIKATAHALATSESPAQILLQQISKLDGRLVVMGAYGQPALKEFFLGSVTRTLLKESPVPLFLYH
jgi:nucleotide-binding universal stress UspA family protein